MSKQVSSIRSHRLEQREKAQRQRKQQNLMLGIAGVVLVALIALVIWLNVRATLPVAGEESFTTQGNTHIKDTERSPIPYNSTPPTSGPHRNGVAQWGIHDAPLEYEAVVHNLEDKGVIVYYQCPEACPEITDKLKEIVQPYANAGRHVLMLPNDPKAVGADGVSINKEMGSKIALTAWQKLLKLDTVDVDLIRRFIDRYEGIDHHTGVE